MTIELRNPSFSGVIGVAREDITPPIDVYARNWGAAEHEVAEGIHRPLTCTAITFQGDSEHRLLLISLDLGWWRTVEDEANIRKPLFKLGFREGDVMVHLTHTHAGPSICAEDSDRPGGHLIQPYLENIREKVRKCAESAITRPQPATLTWRYGRCGLAADRDLPDPERNRVLSGFNPNKEADDTLLVGRMTADSGEPLATIVNYACHPTTLAWQNKLISPDYVGAMREVVETAQGGAPCLFLLGAAGELAPREQYTDDVNLADSHGRELGYAVLSVLQGMGKPNTQLHYEGVVESGAPLAVWKRAESESSNALKTSLLDVEVPLKPWPAIADLETEIAHCSDRALKERLVRKARIRRIIGDAPSTKRSLWIWQLGDSIILGHANEAYSLLQTTLHAAFPDKAVAVANLVNGACGYLPTANMYDHDAYPVWQTPFERGSLERIIEESLRGIEELTR